MKMDEEIRDLSEYKKLNKLMNEYISLGEDGDMYIVLDDFLCDNEKKFKVLIDSFLTVFEDVILDENRKEDSEEGQYILYVFYSHYVEKIDDYSEGYFWKRLSSVFENNLNSESITNFLKYDILGYYFGNTPYSIMRSNLISNRSKDRLDYLRETAY